MHYAAVYEAAEPDDSTEVSETWLVSSPPESPGLHHGTTLPGIPTHGGCGDGAM